MCDSVRLLYLLTYLVVVLTTTTTHNLFGDSAPPVNDVCIDNDLLSAGAGLKKAVPSGS